MVKKYILGFLKVICLTVQIKNFTRKNCYIFQYEMIIKKFKVNDDVLIKKLIMLDINEI